MGNAPLKAAEALTIAGVHAAGNANNVNYGAAAIRSSIARLDELGILHTGAGVNSVEARKPVIVERDGMRFGFLQRTSVYWSHGHEATANYPGVATIKAYTAYRPQIEQLRTLTRPGMPPEVITWADPAAPAQFREDMATLRSQADVVIASHRWGLDHEVLDYQEKIAPTCRSGSRSSAPLPQSRRNSTSCVASRHASPPRLRSRATTSWCGHNPSTGRPLAPGSYPRLGSSA
jgi:hypothetical protein